MQRRILQQAFESVYRMWYNTVVDDKPPLHEGKRVPAVFYQTEAGREPALGLPEIAAL